MPSLDHVSEVLGLVHKRSFNKLQRRAIRNIIFKNAYIDKYRGEIVSRVSRLDVLGSNRQPRKRKPTKRQIKRPEGRGRPKMSQKRLIS
jgi:hypothetical protein